MAKAKFLAGSTTVANTEATVYTAPSDKSATVIINVCTRSTEGAVSIKTNDFYLEKDTTAKVLERSSVVIQAGKTIKVTTSLPCDIQIFGIEE